jgi:hypothetical protein
MTSEEFAQAMADQGSEASVRMTVENLEQPPGRRPKPPLVRRSEWFKGLSESDRQMLIEVVREAAENAVFGVLAILDGARVIEDSEEKGELELYYVKGHERVLLNDHSKAPLHDVYNGLCAQQ